jgi:hypothetical protein
VQVVTQATIVIVLVIGVCVLIGAFVLGGAAVRASRESETEVPEPAAPRTCDRCGHANAGAARFCAQCGNRLPTA